VSTDQPVASKATLDTFEICRGWKFVSDPRDGRADIGDVDVQLQLTTSHQLREAEIIKMIAEGLSVPEIAKRLHLAASTIKTHVQNLYDKLGVSDRGAAVAEAMRRRLLE